MSAIDNHIRQAIFNLRSLPDDYWLTYLENRVQLAAYAVRHGLTSSKP
ncbi:hypothetical protein [Aneurinibacillus terranovensis]|nr:hypothetical protein [Aneurinibacillus terranovensis]